MIFIGRLGTLPLHRHPIPVCLVALGAPFHIGIATPAEDHVCRTALVPARCSHSLAGGGEPVAVIYNDPHVLYYRRLSPNRPSELGSLEPEGEASLISALRNLYSQHQAGEELLFGEFDASAEQALGVEPRQPQMDKRIRQVLSTVKADIDRNHSIEELARCVGLSSGRLQHLFVHEVGVPFRTFRIWIRFRAAVERIGSGQSITSAALDAGFSSSSHFSHAFKATFGLTAASLLKGLAPKLRVQLIQ